MLIMQMGREHSFAVVLLWLATGQRTTLTALIQGVSASKYTK